MPQYHPPDNKEWKTIQDELLERGWTVSSLSVAVYEKHYSDGQTNWLDTPTSLDSWLHQWAAGRHTLGGQLLENIEAVLGCKITELCDTLVDVSQ